MIDKHVLRTRIRTARDTFVAEAPPALVPPFRFIASLEPGLTIASYVAIGSEADPAPFARAALAAGCRLALPHVTTRTASMRFFGWDGEATLLPGPFGLRQPASDTAPIAPDVILTPLLAFDSRLNRLGQGAGYYDRAFAQFPAAWRIGVAWSVQRVEIVPTEPWDVPLHAIVTERGWSEC